MKVNFHHVLKNIEGEPLEDERLQEVTLGKVAITALMNIYDDERTLSGEDKIKRWDLAQVIYAIKDGESLDIPTETIVLLKTLINKSYGVIVVGQAWQVLEGSETLID